MVKYAIDDNSLKDFIFEMTHIRDIRQ